MPPNVDVLTTDSAISMQHRHDSEWSDKRTDGRVGIQLQTASVCFYHIRRLRQLREMVSQETVRQLVTSLVVSLIDYCNVVLSLRPTCVDHLCHSSVCRMLLHVLFCDWTVGRTFLQLSVNFTGHQSSTASSSKSRCSCTKSPLNVVRRTLPTFRLPHVGHTAAISSLGIDPCSRHPTNTF